MILLPREVDDLDSFSRILSAGRVGLFSDFDGTLTPLFDDPRNTVLSPAIRDTLSELSKKVELVAVVSGREVRFLREKIGLKSVTYVGNHGLEEWKTGGEQQEYVVQVSDGLLEEIEKGVAGIWGLGVIRGKQSSERGGALPERPGPYGDTVCGIAIVEVLGCHPWSADQGRQDGFGGRTWWRGEQGHGRWRKLSAESRKA